MASDAYAKTHPFAHLVDIEDPSAYRLGIGQSENETLGRLAIDPPGETVLETELPFAYHEMSERANSLIVRPLQIGQATLYVIVAAAEAEEKIPVLAAHWAKLAHTAPTACFLGRWALGFQLVWTFTKEAAERIRLEAFGS